MKDKFFMFFSRQYFFFCRYEYFNWNIEEVRKLVREYGVGKQIESFIYSW